MQKNLDIGINYPGDCKNTFRAGFFFKLQLSDDGTLNSAFKIQLLDISRRTFFSVDLPLELVAHFSSLKCTSASSTITVLSGVNEYF